MAGEADVDRAGRTVAAINVSAHASRTPLDAVRRKLLPPLLATAARIEADLPARIPGQSSVSGRPKRGNSDGSNVVISTS